ncbi:MAG: HEAT repeat domain-containing protein, partial [Caldilineaceae bacterium]|nr:HEAT repeat domain-containing protein [Caldilineaceae bacterium]
MTTDTSAEQTPTASPHSLLNSSDPAVRFNAGLDLVRQGDPTGIPALIEALGHESASVRLFHAGKALVQLGQPAIPALEQALQSELPQVRIAAACLLYQIEPARFAALLPYLNAALQSEEQQVLADALHFLSLAAEEDRQSVVPALLTALRSPKPADDLEGWATDQRTTVAIVLAKIGEPREPIVAALVAALQGAIPAVRWGAACGLAEMGTAARVAIAALTATVRNEEEEGPVRVEAAYALAVIGDPKGETLPVLLDAVQCSSAWVRAFAARILGAMTAPPTPFEEPTYFDAITRALMGMRGLPHLAESSARVVTALAQAVTDPDFNVRRNAVAALARLESQASAAVPTLLTALHTADIGPMAAETLAKIGGEEVVARLQAALQTENSTTAAQAAYALKLLDGTPPADHAVAPLEPTPHHFYCQVQVTLDAEKIAAFEALYQATLARGQGETVAYTLPYPKHEFLRYLVEGKGLFLHGSGKPDIDVLRPFRYGTDAADHGNVSGIYADRDPIRPVYFAVVEGKRCFGMTNGYFNLTESGEHSTKGDLPCNERFYKLAIGVNGLCRPFWRTGMIYVLPPDTFTYEKEWTSRQPVPPLLRVPVTHEDLPLHEQVWG